MKLRIKRVDLEFVTPLRIAYRTQTHARCVVVEVEDAEGCIGRGEGLAVTYHGETADSLAAQLAALPPLDEGIDCDSVQALLPPGGARNALDCALWDLEAKRTNTRAWTLAGIFTVRPLLSAYTLGMDSVENMASTAAELTQYPLLKIKLGGEDDLARVKHIRDARPDARIIVDANQSWDLEKLMRWAPDFADLGVELIEQPLSAGEDAALAGYSSPVPLCADESCQTSESVPRLVDQYAYVNIKLDKAGGLTEALKIAHSAAAHGMKRMVGCMAGSSLAMAPAFIIGQLCDVVDLDGPLLAKADIPNGIRYEGGLMHPPQPDLWG